MANIPPPSIDLLRAIFPLQVKHPDATFLACLAPLLQTRVQLLSIGRGEAWPGALCWGDHSAGKIVARGVRALSHREIDGYVLLGYARLDEETLVSGIDLAGVGLEVHFLWSEDAANESEHETWKIMGIQPKGLASKHDWHENMESAEVAFAHQANDVDQDNGYWNMYDKDASVGLSVPSGPSNAAMVDAEADDSAYYKKYEEVEPQLDHGDEQVPQAGNRPAQSGPLYLHIQTSIQSLAHLAVAHRITRAEFARAMQTGLQDIEWPSEHET